jgi:hypothetical protein
MQSRMLLGIKLLVSLHLHLAGLNSIADMANCAFQSRIQWLTMTLQDGLHFEQMRQQMLFCCGKSCLSIACALCVGPRCTVFAGCVCWVTCRYDQ